MAALLFWVGILSAFPVLILTPQPSSKAQCAMRAMPLILLALSAYTANAPPFLTMALILAMLGDFALSGTGRMAALYSICSFALMHLLFILLFQSLGAGALWMGFALRPVFVILLLIAMLSSEMWLAPYAGPMRWIIRAYFVLITLMGLFAFGLPAEYELVAYGAFLLLLSDLVLSLVRIRLTLHDPRRVWAGRLRWGLFILGHALILWGVAGL